MWKLSKNLVSDNNEIVLYRVPIPRDSCTCFSVSLLYLRFASADWQSNEIYIHRTRCPGDGLDFNGGFYCQGQKLGRDPIDNNYLLVPIEIISCPEIFKTALKFEKDVFGKRLGEIPDTLLVEIPIQDDFKEPYYYYFHDKHGRCKLLIEKVSNTYFVNNKLISIEPESKMLYITWKGRVI